MRIDIDKLDVRFTELDDSNLPEMAELYKTSFAGDPWNDDWSDPVQLMEYVREISGAYNALNFGLFIDGELGCAAIISALIHVAGDAADGGSALRHITMLKEVRAHVHNHGEGVVGRLTGTIVVVCPGIFTFIVRIAVTGIFAVGILGLNIDAVVINGVALIVGIEHIKAGAGTLAGIDHNLVSLVLSEIVVLQGEALLLHLFGGNAFGNIISFAATVVIAAIVRVVARNARGHQTDAGQTEKAIE